MTTTPPAATVPPVPQQERHIPNRQTLEGNDPFGMRRFSLRRYTVRHLLYMLVTLAVLAAVTARLSFTDDTLTLALSAAGMTMMTVVFILSLRATLKRIVVEQWIRRLGMGDFEYRLEPKRNTEVDKMVIALENVRQRALEAMQLNEVQRLSQELQNRNAELESALEELSATQDQVVNRQKLAELGELTAGVAHEISNPLNLIQNFARTSDSMMAELTETVAGLQGPPGQEDSEVLEELTTELTANMGRIRQHGDRANRIVQDMLAMGRNTKGQYQTISLNDLVEDNAMLTYHSAKAQNPAFNLTIIRDYDPATGQATVVPEDIGRVVLNLVSNACYATAERADADPDHDPTMWLATARRTDAIEISVRDNGPGMTPEVIEKAFNPFFTTKPAARGTGLGLSLSNDIIREHGGTIKPESDPGNYTLFTIRLPAPTAPPRPASS